MEIKWKKLDIPEVLLLTYSRFTDYRGSLTEIFQASQIGKELGIRFVQDNISRSIRKVWRGLHYQLRPKAQGKLITCLYGRIYDFAVDIRIGSPHFGEGVFYWLTDASPQSLWVPPGFAHGFYVDSQEAIVHYKLTNEHDPTLERGINILSDGLKIVSPIESGSIMSERDQLLPTLKKADNNLYYKAK